MTTPILKPHLSGPKKRAGMKCMICQRKRQDLVWHHISYVPPETILLCNECHSKLHQNPVWRQKFSHFLKQTKRDVINNFEALESWVATVERRLKIIEEKLRL